MSLKTLECVNKNLSLIQTQLQCANLNVDSFPLFIARNSFFMLLAIEKNYERVDGNVKKLYDEYLEKAKEHRDAFFKAKNVSLKDKLIFYLIIKNKYRWYLKLCRQI